MTPEGKVKDAVKKFLREQGAYYFMPVQNGMGAPGLDFHCCYRGRAFFIETKAPGAKLTERQQLTRGSMELAGGMVFVIDGVEEKDMYQLKNWFYWVQEQKT